MQKEFEIRIQKRQLLKQSLELDSQINKLSDEEGINKLYYFKVTILKNIFFN